MIPPVSALIGMRHRMSVKFMLTVSRQDVLVRLLRMHTEWMDERRSRQF